MATTAGSQPRPAPDRPLRELRGVVERITYQNPDNDYTVARLAPKRPEGEAEAARGGGRAYRPGDRVLQLRDDYDLKVYNGDLGTVREVDPTEQEVLLDLDDGRECATSTPACSP